MQRVLGIWQGGERIDISLSNGMEIVVDENGPKSTDLVLAGLVNCSTGVLLTVLNKMRVTIKGLEIETEAERATERPKIFTKINLIYRVEVDEGLETKVVNAVKLGEKYCTVYNVLRPGTNIEVSCYTNGIKQF